MGILDIFKKKQKTVETQSEKSFDIKYKVIDSGKLQIDFCIPGTKLSHSYDTTRLIIDRKPLAIGGECAYNCAVSWYSQDDADFYNPKYGFEKLDAINYKGILAQIDFNLLQKDENYCNVVMTSLLDKIRVNEILLEGLQDSPRTSLWKICRRN